MATGDDRADMILDAVYGSGHHSDFPATVYVTLYYESPDDSGGGTEADYAGFARVAVTNNDTNFPDASGRLKELATDVAFAVPAADTDPFVAWAIHGHATNDDIITWEEFTTPISGRAGKNVTIEAGTIGIALV